jgi:pimeloyl-[acyl-carrier protein] methyl ester esterase
MKNNLLHLKIVGKGQPLVLLHGWGWHSGIWEPLVPYLSDQFELFMPDLPGCGKSYLLDENYTFDAIAKRLLAAVPDQAVWLGWSLGGLLAWWVALHYPEKVTRLITIASSPRFVQDANWPGIPLTLLRKFGANLVHDYEKTLNDFLSLQLRGTPAQETWAAALQKTVYVPSISALEGGLTLLEQTDLRSQLSQLTLPSLHIFGNLDTLVPVSVVPQLQPLLSPQAQCHILPRAGHLLFLSKREEFIKILRQFLF